MSSISSLWLLDKDYYGHIEKEYHDSWLFHMAAWEAFAKNYQTTTLNLDGFHRAMSNKIGFSQSQSEWVIWYLTHHMIFSSKDKEVVSKRILEFCEENEISSKQRWQEISDDILNINPEEYPYFVLKHTHIDTAVSGWFLKGEDFEEKQACSLREKDEKLTYFVHIEDGKIKGFTSNTNYFGMVDVKQVGSKNTIKKCPCCNHVAFVREIDDEDDYYWEVFCGNEDCGLSIREGDKHEVIRRWNKRVKAGKGE